MSAPGVETPAPAWPRVLKLQHPVEVAGERIAELSFRRGTIKDLKGMKLGDTVPTEQLVLIAARLSGQVTQVIDALDMDDAGEVMDIALSFFEKCLTVGRKR